MANHTTQFAGKTQNLTPLKTKPERILQSETNFSFRTVLKNPGVESLKQGTVDTLKHALATNDEGPSQDTVPVDAAAHFSLASQEFHAIML